jgi:hypothetical protein
MKETNITFKLESPTYISVIRDGIVIGQIFSQNENHPYPHDDSEYCLNSIQICGFDKMSEIWACGVFSGKKDCVVHFLPTDSEYYKRKSIEYSEYVKTFFSSTSNIIKTGVEEMQISKIVNKDGKDINKLMSFKDWLQVNPF